MRRFRPVLGGFTVGMVIAALSGSPSPVGAQSDFLLKTPRASVGVRVGYAFAMASSDVFDLAREQLTLDRSDFSGGAFGLDVGITVAPRVDITFGLARATSSSSSEFRDWVDDRDLPIEQVTSFARMPVTVGVKAYLRDRGRSIGRFAWIPNRLSPFVGAAGGVVWYRFEQDGDFVDFETLDVFHDRFTQDGRAPTVHLYGGADWSLGPALFLTGEGRYSWATADMSGDFVGFNAMDLSGFQGTVGLSVRF